MLYKNLLIEERQGIGIVTLNRPQKRNALDWETLTEIREVFRSIRSNPDIKTVVLTGSGGKAFASGADINALKKRDFVETLHSETQAILNEIEYTPKPVIAAIDGYALGGGCELAMACDIRIATAKSKLGLPEVNLGLIPGAGGTQRLRRYVGIGKAKELIFTGAIISALEAKEIGLINKLVDTSEELMPATLKMAETIQSKGPMAVAMAKITINNGANTDLNSGLLIEKLAQTVLFGTEDRKEGISAFLDKRAAKFKGC